MGTETVLALVTWLAVAATLITGRAMSRAGADMKLDGGAGIVPFELAETPREAMRIMRAWGDRGKAAARRSLRRDTAFLLSYGTALGAASGYVAVRAERQGAGWLAVVAACGVVGAVLAAVLDAVENATLLGHLDGRLTPTTVRRARGAAQAKFALVSLVALVVLVGFGLLQLVP